MSYADLRHGLILAPMAGVTDYAFLYNLPRTGRGIYGLGNDIGKGAGL